MASVAALSLRVAVVTGANKGIGRCIAEQLRDSGAFGRIIVACRNEGLGRAAVADLGAPCEFAPLDLASSESIDAFAQYMTTDVGRCDGLVNNAGLAFKGSDPTPFEGQTGPTLAVNFWGTARLTDALLPLLRQRPEADKPFVVNVASMAGKLAQIKNDELREQFTAPGLTREKLNALVTKFQDDVASNSHQAQGWGSSNYGFSKLALIAYTKLVAREEQASGSSAVKVNCCCPGYCDTDMSSHRGSRSPAEGARNAVMLVERALGDDLNGAFVQDYEVSAW